ncbi:ATP-binding cassette domain-containing protein [Janibacter melonis]|uniref:ATP-binding cassette domain-containing protein n=1 Tax=Janibacter melonis TaxID=262209 RepID=UPI00082F18E8
MAEGEVRGTPTVVASHLDVVYRVVGGSAPGGRRLTRARPDAREVAAQREVHAVRDVSFVAHHGESIGIIGRNGSGKSTLLRAVAGLIPPTHGQLWVAGEPSLLGVNAVLMSQLSGERNIYIGGQALGLSRSEVRDRFDSVVEFSGIGDAVYRPMRTYSSGMGARLRFAISTSAAPDVLMIDEALATGDAHFRERSTERIRQIREEAGTVFLVSHSNGSIRAICDRVLWMDEGRLVMDGPTEEVLGAYEDTLPTRSRTRRSSDDVPGVERVGGEDRVETAVLVARRGWSAGCDGVFLVPHQGSATISAVAPTAGRLGWPVLLTYKGALPEVVIEELDRLSPRTVAVVGAEDLVSTRVEEQVRATGAEVTRVDALSPTDIGRQTVRTFEPGLTVDEVVVIRDTLHGANTALTARATVAGSMLVILDDDRLDEETLRTISGVAPVRIVLATPEDDRPVELLAQLDEIAPVEHDSRRGAARLVAEAAAEIEPDGGVTYVSLVLATYETLVAAVAAAKDDRPFLVLPSRDVPSDVAAEIGREAPSGLVVVGGPAQVDADLQQVLSATMPGS